MKTLLALIFTCLLACQLQAQAPYTGGAGGGYASTSIPLSIVEPGQPVGLFPSPAQAGATLQLSVTGLRHKLEVRVWDPTGRLLHRERHWGVQGDQIFALQAPDNQGLYLVEWITDGHSQVQKLIVFAP
jgi:hypothetical protein